MLISKYLRESSNPNELCFIVVGIGEAENHLGNEMFQLVLLEWKRARLAFCILTFEETC